MSEALTVSIDHTADKVEPSLEEQAIAAGIDVGSIDTSAEEQTATGDKLLGKFENVDALAKAYQELEKKLGQKPVSKDDETHDDVEEEVAEDDEAEDEAEKTAEEQAREVTEKAGLDFDEMSRRFWENGDLSEDDYKSLEKAGISKGVVDQFIKGQEALLEQTRQSVFNDVGGEDNYKEITAWARDNLSKEEITTFNSAVNSGDINAARMAVKGLKARHDAEVGFEPTRRVKANDKVVTAERFESWAQVTAAMADPRYQKDPAYRRAVEAKVARSEL